MLPQTARLPYLEDFMLGSILTINVVVLLGVVSMIVIVFQMLLGYRKIKFKGRTHWTVHKWVGWSIVALGVVHGLAALAYLSWWPF